MTFPGQFVFGGEFSKIILLFLSGRLQVIHIQFDAHEVPALGIVRMLLAVQDIERPVVEPGGCSTEYAFAILALDEEYNFFLCFCHGCRL